MSRPCEVCRQAGRDRLMRDELRHLHDPDEYEVGSGGTSRSLPELDDRPVLTDRAEVVLRALEDERIEASRALDLLSERRAGPAAWTPQRYFRERAEERLEARRTT